MKMDNDTFYGKIYTFVSILSAGVSMSDAYEIVKLIGAIIAIISGIMAIRYYHHATKKIKSHE